MALLNESLYQTLSIYEKCLSFDFTAILLNETLDDPTSTNVPTSWRPIITETSTLQDLFTLLRVGTPVQVKSTACQCIAHLANCRHSLFDNVESRIQFVTQIATELINFMKT